MKTNDSKRAWTSSLAWAIAIGAAAGLAAILNPAACRADGSYYGFNPMSTLVLGHGLSPNHLDQAKIPCVQFKEAPADPGALGTQFYYSIVTSSETLDEALGVDQSIDASFLGFKGSESFSYSTSGMFRGNSVTMVIRASTEYGRRTITDVALTPYAQGLIDHNEMARFESDCGSYLVTLERLGSSVAAIITLEQVASDASSSLNLGVGGGGDFSLVSAQAKLSFKQQMKDASRSGYLDVQVVSTGGGGLGSLSEVVKASAAEESAYDKIEVALSAYLKDFGPANPAPIGFHVVPMPFGFRPNQANLWDERKQSLLAGIVTRYRSLKDNADLIRKLIALADDGTSFTDSGRIAAYQAELPSLEDFLDLLAATHKRCMDEMSLDACKLPAPAGGGFVVPELPALPKLNTSKEGKSTLHLQGMGIQDIELFLNQDRVWQDRSNHKDTDIVVDLKPYWDRRRLIDRGPVSGKLVVHDVFGRSLETCFHKAVHPYEGGPALHEEFRSEGGL